MLEKNGAQVLCDCLQREGVEVVFGIPGVHNVYLFEALRRAKIRVVIATHEQAVGFMANGYSRATGKTGVFVTVPGPGFTNAFTSIAESLLDSCAVIGIVTGTRNDLAKEFQLHEIHQVDLARPIVKQVYQVSKASQVAENARTAFRLAQSEEPGPVILEIAANVYWERAPFTQSETKQTLEEPGRDEDANIHQVVALIKQAKHIGLFVGQGALDAAEQITQIAEWLVAPVATTVSGRGCLREDHPLAVDFRWGKHGVELTNQVFAKCDLVIAVGAKFSENGTAGYSLRFTGALVQVDSSPGVVGKNYPAVLTLQMDARDFFNKLLENKTFIGPREDTAILEIIKEQKAKRAELVEGDGDGIRFALGSQNYSPRRFFGVLREILAEDAILVTDSGYNQFFAIENFRVLAPRTLITPSDYQSMGYCIPSAIGAAIACPTKQVVALVGDGGFVMSGLELLTAYREKLNLLVIVLNDGYFGFMKEIQEELFGATIGVTLENPDFKKLAESLHVHYHTATGDITATLQECIQHPVPVLLEVPVTYPHKALMPILGRRWKSNLREWAKEGRHGLEQVRLSLQNTFDRTR